MKSLPLLVLVLASVSIPLAAGAGPKADQRREIALALLKKQGQKIGRDFTQRTLTEPLGTFTGIECKAPKEAGQEDDVYIPLGLCTFSYKHPQGRKFQLRANASGHVVLKGDSDPGKAVNGKPAKPEKRTIASADAGETYSWGTEVPAIEAFKLKDDKKRDAWVQKATQAWEKSETVEQFSESADCTEGESIFEFSPSHTKTYCYSYLADRWNGIVVVTFETKNGEAVGVRAISFSGNM